MEQTAITIWQGVGGNMTRIGSDWLLFRQSAESVKEYINFHWALNHAYDPLVWTEYEAGKWSGRSEKYPDFYATVTPLVVEP